MPTCSKDIRKPGPELLVGRNVISSWIKAVEGAQESIRLVQFKLSSPSALEALTAAERRGVKIEMIFDGTTAQSKKSLVRNIQPKGLNVILWPSDLLGELHAKFTILDDSQVIFGSFNLSESAEENNTEIFFSTHETSTVSEFNRAWQQLKNSTVSASC